MIIYLHKSPVTTARWYNESDALLHARYTGQVISDAIQFTIAETVPHFFPSRELNDDVVWCMQSIEHIMWCYDLHVALRERDKRKGDAYYRFDIHFPTHLGWFPTDLWKDPPTIELPYKYSSLDVPMEYRWRLYYRNERRGKYKKYKPPFWY